MRWDPNDKVFAGLGDDYWRPRLLSQAMVEGAQGDRALWDDVSRNIAGFDTSALAQAKAWADSVKRSLATQATGSLGLPAALSATIASSFGYFAIQPPESVEQLGVDLGKAAIGITTTALGAVPVVGPIAAAIGALANVLIELRSKSYEDVQEFFPPLDVYKPDREEFTMNNIVLPALSVTNWTGLFRPRLGNDLRIARRSNALGAWIVGSADADGLGFLPGSQTISGQIQAIFVKKDDRGGNLVSHQDIGNFYPSVAQLMTAVSSQVQAPGAALYSVRPDLIKEVWREHLEAVFAFLADLWHGKGIKGTGLEGLTTDQRHTVVGALGAPYCVTTFNGQKMRGVLASWSPSYKGPNVFDAFIEPWCAKVKRRQDYYLDTTVCASIDSSSPLTTTHRRTLRRNRKLLLESPARYHVDLDDVVDATFRAELFQATAGSTLVAPTSPRGKEPTVGIDGQAPPTPPPPPQAPQGGPPFGDAGEVSSGSSGSGGGLVVLAAAAVAGLGYALKRRARAR